CMRSFYFSQAILLNQGIKKTHNTLLDKIFIFQINGFHFSIISVKNFTFKN
ncbi:mCG1041450, partial [Mus musculus]